MPEQTISCPSCGEEISFTDTLQTQIEEGVRKKLDAASRRKDEEFKKKEEELQKRTLALDETISRELNSARQGLAREAEKKAGEKLSLEMKALKEENAEKEKRLGEAEKAELELRKRAREVEEKGKLMDLEIARTIDAEREKIKAETLNLFTDEHRLKDAEKDKKLSDMSRLNDEMKRKMEQGSMQTQGEVLEVELEEMLRQSFPVDIIEPVPKGIKGADVLQRVNSSLGQHCGTIAWELKRTKAFNEEWISKLKDDAREVKAEVAVLVTEALPKDITGFVLRDGVWVTSPALATALATALRSSLVQLSHARNSVVGKGEKMEMVYNYLSGPEFKHRVEALVEAFRTMQEELDKEKRAMTNIWSKREKQIDRIMRSTAGLYGDVHGLIGATLPEIKALELESGEEAEEGAGEETLEGS
jgi:hypothetical protein